MGRRQSAQDSAGVGYPGGELQEEDEDEEEEKVGWGLLCVLFWVNAGLG